jgi:hypothetical protein
MASAGGILAALRAEPIVASIDKAYASPTISRICCQGTTKVRPELGLAANA